MVSVTTAPGSAGDTASAGMAPPSTSQAARDERLVSVLSRARPRAMAGLSETALFVLGGAFAVAGIVLVIIGWVGTSRTVLVAGQIPYLVSGGLLGLALVFLGGFLYFGYWLALMVRENRERAESDRADFAQLRASLEEVSRSLGTVAEQLGRSKR
jgi:ABC-type Fe3+ transport system permease subunit